MKLLSVRPKTSPAWAVQFKDDDGPESVAKIAQWCGGYIVHVGKHVEIRIGGLYAKYGDYIVKDGGNIHIYSPSGFEKAYEIGGIVSNDISMDKP